MRSREKKNGKARQVGDGEKREDTEGWGEEGMSLGNLCLYTGIGDSTNQKHYPDLGCDESSVSSFCARFSEVIWRGNQWYCGQMSAVF